MAPNRIYHVKFGETERLVRATRQSVALAHVAQSVIAVQVATQNHLELLLPNGIKVETAGDAPAPAAGAPAHT